VDVLFARSQMAVSLGFHILFAAAGIALPVLMVISEILWRRTKDPTYEALTRTWAKGTAVLFAVGAVSGTVLSFELGLLFPGFMARAGAVVGLPFSLEGFAFFTEAIFLGVYLYGWDRVRPSLHILSGVVVAVSGMASALFVTIANAWMNAPRGFRVEGGAFVDVDPWAAMGTPFALHEVAHMLLASYMAVGFAAAAIHAALLLRRRGDAFHRRALGVTLGLAIPCTLLQPLVGHFAGQQVARFQPMKLAAIEHLVETRDHAPIHVGPLEIPSGLSILAFNRPSATVRGLAEIPRRDWPHPVVRWAFQAMVALGTLEALVAAWALWLRLRRRAWADQRALLWATVASGPLGLVAIEAGWIVTEVGRQPWVVYGVLRTAETATPMPGLAVPFVTFSLVYLGLAVAVVLIILRQVRGTSHAAVVDGAA
jgi:cytochrome d ubiquinol oxidase subunit I